MGGGKWPLHFAEVFVVGAKSYFVVGAKSYFVPSSESAELDIFDIIRRDSLDFLTSSFHDQNRLSSSGQMRGKIDSKPISMLHLILVAALPPPVLVPAFPPPVLRGALRVRSRKIANWSSYRRSFINWYLYRDIRTFTGE